MDEDKKACICYLSARRKNPEYLKRDYWWKECAGSLFETGHYRFAELFYKKSIELKPFSGKLRLENNDRKERKYIYPLIGDSLFFQGKFIEAKEWFIKYKDEVDNILIQFELKLIACNYFIKNSLSDKKINVKESELRVEQAIQDKPNAKIIELLLEAIEENPLNELAWFNLGFANSENQDNREFSSFCFLVAGLLNPRDTEALMNAFMLGLEKNDNVISSMILLYLDEVKGEQLINEITEYFINNKNVSIEERKGHLEFIKNILNKLKTEGAD
jgi:tetratricopeptide (TPR) repeat protein